MKLVSIGSKQENLLKWLAKVVNVVGLGKRQGAVADTQDDQNAPISANFLSSKMIKSISLPNSTNRSANAMEKSSMISQCVCPIRIVPHAFSALTNDLRPSGQIRAYLDHTDALPNHFDNLDHFGGGSHVDAEAEI